MLALLLLGALVGMSFAMTTKEQRAAANARFHPWDKIAAALALILAIAMCFPGR